MDKPNERSMHSIPTIRGGGLVFIGIALLALPLLSYWQQSSFQDVAVFFVSLFFLAGISFLDDLYQLSAKTRFLVQIAVAILVVLFMRPEHLDFGFFNLNYSFLIIPVVFVTALWAINHFNFMDGLDGFCASQALFLFTSYAFLFGYYNASMYQEFCFIMIFSLTGFLLFNFPPAKLFMGDVGSASLGLITFCIALIAQQKYEIPIVYFCILNGLFLFDATITLTRRIINKEKWSAPHRKHAYQRLKQYGVDTRIILLSQTVINSLFLATLLLFRNNKISLILLLPVVLGILIGVYSLIERLFPMYQNKEY